MVGVLYHQANKIPRVGTIKVISNGAKRSKSITRKITLGFVMTLYGEWKILTRKRKNSPANLCLNVNLHNAHNVRISQAENVAIKNDPGVVQTLGGLEIKSIITLEGHSPHRVYKGGNQKRPD